MIKRHQGIPVLGFAGFSGSGKTTILTQVIKRFNKMGKNVAIIKHTHHHFDIDKKGKDSYRFREAGANQVIVGSKNRFALMVEIKQDEPDLSFLLNKLNTEELDLILFEGFKHEQYPKIEVNRQGLEHPWLFLQDQSIIAVATDDAHLQCELAVLDINDVEKILVFIDHYLRNAK